tara:strand:+ start:260 stop:976 length:717 start_codon:yes stop_codon:yes gene_type:complete
MLHKLELDVMQSNELLEAARLTVKYNLPSMVVHPELSSEAYIARGQLKGNFKIITPVDWPKGTNNTNNAMDKMRGLSTDALEVEGFEIVISPNKSLKELIDEMQLLTQFIKEHLGEANLGELEVRFVISCFNRDEDHIKLAYEALKEIRKPDLIRNDSLLKLQVSKANIDNHNKFVEESYSHISCPVKISGNVNNYRVVTAVNEASRFAVNLTQAKNIIKEYNQQPSNQIKELINDKE